MTDGVNFHCQENFAKALSRPACYNRLVMRVKDWIAPAVALPGMVFVLAVSILFWRDVGTDIDCLDSDVSNLHISVARLETDMAYVKEDIAEMKNAIERIRSFLENDCYSAIVT